MAFMPVPVAVAMHLRCHKSTSPNPASCYSDKTTFSLFVGRFVRQGAGTVLLGMSPIVEISDS
jgi:hypothetical protein